ncbi:hypothetical protein DL96DRAFT_1463673 [Flagelloscypha sp. PMI_526]|nr:hypothetical protein DL96DRAFT_1463673 [Flagelloscypha sp. PMI_526]
MLFGNTFTTLLATVLVASALPLRKRVNTALIPEFGIQAGQNPTGTGDCDGVNGIKIPCTCPPDRQLFIDQLNANVAAGRPVNNPNPAITVSFPEGDSKADKLARLNTATVTLQNLFGAGKGCPQAATTFGAQVAAVNAGTDAPAPAPAPAAPAPAAPAPAPAAPAAGGVDPALVPEFGIQAGQNPTGTGDCDGANGVKIPCTCPPDRQFFIDQLNANVKAGRPVNNPNPAITVQFPTGNSKGDKLARLNAATVTLQNLFGAGKGCPQAATTFGAQVAAVNAGP